ncbi:MAG: hydantoinase B/oxoprolinase family protein, partial [Phycisphaerae bacterium]|nr:hydantoinase B/oxoprolinase family protein [Phycisphaerae bacterium]
MCTHKLLSSGVYKGHVGAGSSRDAVVDLGRCADPRGFFNGWRLRLLPSVSDAKNGNDAPAVDFELPVRAFDASTGTLALDGRLNVEPRVGLRYELCSDAEAPLIGIHYLLGTPLHTPVGAVQVRLGTTRGTNALLERRGAPTAFVTTAGFVDVLRIGTQQRPRLFDLHVRKPASLHAQVVEIDERVGADGAILRPLDEDAARRALLALRGSEIEAVAICLLNSYRNDAHERRLAEIVREVGFEHVSVSSQLLPLQRIVPRGETTVVNAYLTPVIGAYLASLRAALPEAALKLMTSAGGLVDAGAFVAKDSILSGPAAGVVGAAHVARAAGFEQAIGFDMGGTSTDVSRYAGEFERRHEMELEDSESGGAVRVVAPMLAIETVAAGGGSICDFDGIKPTVGPRSAGANPGPACYGADGPLCVTDVNLYLGRVPADLFPFPLDRDAVERRLDEQIQRIAEATGRRYDRHELAAGYVAIANTHMAAAIKKISVQRGYDPRDDVLVSFGGAGGQHACAIARELGIRRILAHPYAGVLSAYGIGMADVMRFAARDVGRPLSEETLAVLKPVFAELDDGLRAEVRAEGISPDCIAPGRRLLDLRYAGQDATITIADPDGGDWRAAFEQQHQQLYGFTHPEREIEIYATRLEVTGHTPKPDVAAGLARDATGEPLRYDEVWFNGGPIATPVYRRDGLRVAERYDGPAIILEATSTIVVELGWSAELSERGDIILSCAASSPTQFDPSRAHKEAVDAEDDHFAPQPLPHSRGSDWCRECDPITLELYNNQFAAIAEQMGATLQRTALSTNIKERLDFSCAIYDAAGGLVAHAAHIPVHIGAMGHCVEYLISSRGASGIAPGEVYVTNDPYHGGSHLPDVTVITPVFDDAGREVLFYAANRAHHSEIG